MNRHTPYTLFLAPSGSDVGLTTSTLGLVRALDVRGVRVAFCKPIGQSFNHDDGPERSTHFIRSTTQLTPAGSDPAGGGRAADFRRRGGAADGARRRPCSTNPARMRTWSWWRASSTRRTGRRPRASIRALARTLSAHVILAGSLEGDSPEDFADFESRMELSIREFGGTQGRARCSAASSTIRRRRSASTLEEIREAVLRGAARFSRGRNFRSSAPIPENSGSLRAAHHRHRAPPRRRPSSTRGKSTTRAGEEIHPARPHRAEHAQRVQAGKHPDRLPPTARMSSWPWRWRR